MKLGTLRRVAPWERRGRRLFRRSLPRRPFSTEWLMRSFEARCAGLRVPEMRVLTFPVYIGSRTP